MVAQRDMKPITLSAVVGEDRRLIIDLPSDTPVGQVELVIRPAMAMPPSSANMTREEARAILLAAGSLVTTIHAPEGTVPLTPEQILEIRKLPPGARSSDELVDEDRGLY
ncbi:MAG: hypothetical protein ABI690_23520 [Chloroflexota bacterium]